jgi:hypothetical protein
MASSQLYLAFPERKQPGRRLEGGAPSLRLTVSRVAPRLMVLPFIVGHGDSWLGTT